MQWRGAVAPATSRFGAAVRRLGYGCHVERRPRVRIFGVERDLRAEVVVMNGFSAHADQKDLVEYALDLKSRGPLRRIALVHGESGPQQALIAKMKERGLSDVHAPPGGGTLEI